MFRTSYRMLDFREILSYRNISPEAASQSAMLCLKVMTGPISGHDLFLYRSRSVYIRQAFSIVSNAILPLPQSNETLRIEAVDWTLEHSFCPLFKREKEGLLWFIIRQVDKYSLFWRIPFKRIVMIRIRSYWRRCRTSLIIIAFWVEDFHAILKAFFHCLQSCYVDIFEVVFQFGDILISFGRIYACAFL